jgi:hypothetical protein
MRLERFGLFLIAAIILTAATRHVLTVGADAAEPFVDLRVVAAPSAAGSLAAQLSASADGRVYLSWLEPAGDGQMRFRLAERRGGSWESRADIVEGRDLFANWADVPSVFAASDGRLAAHWLQKSAGNAETYGIRVRTSADGGRTWSPPFTPHRDASPTEHGFLSFFDAPGREIGMVWLDGRATGGGHGHQASTGAMTLRATTIGGDGRPGPDVLVDDRVCDCCPTAATSTPRGTLVAYRDRSPKEVRDISLARLERGAWVAPGAVHADGWKIPGCPVNGPALAAAGDVVVLVWFTAAGDDGRVLAAFSRDGGLTFGAPARVDDGVTLGRADVELLPDGSAVVVWLAPSQGAGELRARRMFADGRRGPAVTVAAVESGRASGVPRVVRSGNELLFAWRSPGPSPRVTVAVAFVPPA